MMKDTGSFETSILGSRPRVILVSQLALVSGSFMKKCFESTDTRNQLHGLLEDPIWFIFPAIDFVRVPASHIGLPEGTCERISNGHFSKIFAQAAGEESSWEPWLER